MPAAEFMLEHMQSALWDPVDTTRVGSLDPRLHSKVNGEVYRFSCQETLKRFRRNPVRWCGLLRDPVNGERFFPSRRSHRYDYADSPYFFFSDSTYREFRSDPEHYAIHRED